MKIAYHNINFSDWKLAMISQATDIIESYLKQGYPLSLRQLYYQFVSRDLLPARWADKATGSTNNERSYKNLGELISDARLGGLISWDAIEDRTRALAGNSHWLTPESIIASAAGSYKLDKWEGQPYRVEIWVEKDALEGVISRPARILDVNYFSCRGYTSQTSMHDAAMRIKRYIDSGLKVVILHLGDHDPSGIDMTRDITDRLKLFLGKSKSQMEIRRIALNMPQIKKYNPPPNPAKVTDSRAFKYIKAHGKSSWELDALEPTVIDKLITDQVIKLRDDGLYNAVVARERRERDVLDAASENWNKVVSFLADSDLV